MRMLRLAILDLNNGVTNRGIASIKAVLRPYADVLEWKLFDVRAKGELPAAADFDLFIMSGGPGSPLEGDGDWDRRFFALIDELWESNLQGIEPKKYVFFICHSFEMACRHFQIGELSRRKSTSFGTFPCYLTDSALADPIFQSLPNPFYIADFRDWQVVNPDLLQIEALGAEILAMEYVRPHAPNERAIMAVRFSEEMMGTQFHPEADGPGMLHYFQTEEKMVHVLNEYGKPKYEQMIKDLSHPGKIQLTHDTVLPSFLDNSILKLKESLVPA